MQGFVNENNLVILEKKTSKLGKEYYLYFSSPFKENSDFAKVKSYSDKELDDREDGVVSFVDSLIYGKCGKDVFCFKSEELLDIIEVYPCVQDEEEELVSVDLMWNEIITRKRNYLKKYTILLLCYYDALKRNVDEKVSSLKTKEENLSELKSTPDISISDIKRDISMSIDRELISFSKFLIHSISSVKELSDI